MVRLVYIRFVIAECVYQYFVYTVCVCVWLEWNIHYAALLEYYEEHGTCNVTTGVVYECDLEGLGENGGVYHYVGNLGEWLKGQRRTKKGTGHMKITIERLVLLQKLVDEGKCMCVSFHDAKFIC